MLGNKSAEGAGAEFRTGAGLRDPFNHFAQTARSYIRDLRASETCPLHVARVVKELGLLWDDVVDSGTRLTERQKEWKALLDQEIAQAMAQSGVSRGDVAKASLNMTSTGRLTAKPVFLRRFDA